jgi:1-acyl-sn-glycerol-3-phosphate acyltransferase
MKNILRSDHWFIGITYFVLRKFIGFFVRIFLIKRVNGIERIPTHGSIILAFNHQSFFDFICFAAIVPRNVHFLAAEKFFDHKLWKILMIFTGQIKVARKLHDKSSVYESIERHVKKGTLIGIFPEGTRSPDRVVMLKAFTGVAQFALKHHIPIVPVGIQGTFDILSKFDTYPKIRKIVTIYIGDPLHFANHFDKHTNHNVCTYVTENVMREIATLSGKVYKHYESIQV